MLWVHIAIGVFVGGVMSIIIYIGYKVMLNHDEQERTRKGVSK